MNINKLFLLAACLLHVGCCAQTRSVKVLSDAVSVCAEDYQATYRKGKEQVRLQYELMSREAVLQSLFARLCTGEELTEPEYIHVSLSNLPKNAVGGRAHYLVSPASGEILARYHTK